MLLKKDDMESLERAWALACKPRKRVCVFLFDETHPMILVSNLAFLVQPLLPLLQASAKAATSLNFVHTSSPHILRVDLV